VKPSQPAHRWRRACVALALALVGAVSTGCASAPDTRDVAAEPVALAGPARTVTIGVLRQPHLSHALFYRPFLPTNVTLEVVPFANSTEIKNAVVSGDLDLGVTGITSAMQGAAKGEPVVVVAAAADGGSAIVAARDSGITDVAGLRGKRIGFVPASAQDILLRLTLTSAGIDPAADVKLINVQFADMAAALDRGDIDAFAGAEVGPSDALVRGAQLVTHPYATPMGKINIALVTSAATIAGDPELVQAMVAVHARATDHMAAHADEWAEKVESEYGYKPDSLAVALPNIELRWRMDKAYVDQIAVLGGQQVALGQIGTEPDYARFVDMSFVAKLG